jgi:hypothetical protein
MSEIKTESEVSLKDFILSYQNQLVEKVVSDLQPIYATEDKFRCDFSKMEESGYYKIYRQQADVASALVKFFAIEKGKTAFVNGEMGVGKTVIASMVAHGVSQKLEKPIRVLVMCPPQLGGAKKGKKDVIQKWEREIKNAIPDATIKTLNSVADIMYLRQFRKTKPNDKNEFYIVSRETVKLGMGYKLVLNTRTVKIDSGEIVKIPVCPRCGEEIDIGKLAKTRKNWHECRENHPRRDIQGRIIGCVKKEPLWQHIPKPTRRYPLALLIKRYLKGFFDLFVCDEVHEEKGASLRGTVFGQLVKASKRTLALTGTLVGGKASTLHYLLWRTNPGKMRQISAFNNVNETAVKYGVVEKIFKENDDDAYYGRRSKRQVSMKEKPGISPVILTDFLIQNTAFLKLADLRADLPNFEEDVRVVEMDEDLAETYGKFQSDLVSAVENALKHHDRSLLGKMLISLLAYPDNPRVEEVIQNREREVVACAPAMDIKLTAKERELINIIKEEKASGRKVLVYVEFTNIRDIQPQLKKKLEKEGLKAVILPASVSPARRESWINSTLKEKNLDCLVCNPRLVQTGLDLIDFPTIVFYQTGYSTYLLRQASRRSYRIGQSKPVKVIYLVNKNTLQEQAMSLIASKFIASLMIEGELPAEGGLEDLASVETVDSDMVRELAEVLIGNKQIESLDNAWSKYKVQDFTADEIITEPSKVKITETKEVARENEVVKVTVKYRRVTDVFITSQGFATMRLNSVLYKLQDGKVLDFKKNNEVGTYEWKQGKKGKYAEVKVGNKVYFVGKMGRNFVVLEKVEVA